MGGQSLEISEEPCCALQPGIICAKHTAGQPSNGGPKYTIDTSVLPYTAETEGYSCLSGRPERQKKRYYSLFTNMNKNMEIVREGEREILQCMS